MRVQGGERETIPARSFLSKAIGFSDFSMQAEAIAYISMQAEAIAYIGFAGTFLPGEATDPIALCRESLLKRAGRVFLQYGTHDQQRRRRHAQYGGVDEFHPATVRYCKSSQRRPLRPGGSASPSPELTLQVGNGYDRRRAADHLGFLLQLLADQRRHGRGWPPRSGSESETCR